MCGVTRLVGWRGGVRDGVRARAVVCMWSRGGRRIACGVAWRSSHADAMQGDGGGWDESFVPLDILKRRKRKAKKSKASPWRRSVWVWLLLVGGEGEGEGRGAKKGFPMAYS